MRKCLVALTVLFACINTSFALLNGSGTQASPWLIQSITDFDEFTANPAYWSGHTRLDTNVSLSGRTYTKAPIAPDPDTDSTWDGIPFTGIFHGNNHTISHLTINGAHYLSLFGKIDNGSITNLGVENANISGTGNYVGGLCGMNAEGSVTGCYSSGSINGSNYHVGGLCGQNYYGNITSCYSTGSVTGNSRVGGLCGYNFGSITSCYSSGLVTGTNYVGGLCGQGNSNDIITCYFLNTAGPNNNLGTPLTDAQMKQQSSFVGWDFIAEAANGTSDFWMITTGQYPSLYCFDPAFTPYSFSGGGTEVDPYHIATIYDLGAIWQHSSASYVLDNPIDAGGITFNAAVVPSFTGTFNGNSHAISNLTINGGGHLGLFGHTYGGSVANLALENVDISGTGDCYVAGLCGWNGSSITDCYATGTVDGNNEIGGLCGISEDGSITSCYFTGIVTGGNLVGGLCGYNDSSITSCYSGGTVNSDTYVGGFCGWNSGNITNCYSTSSVTGTSYVGGMVGYNSGSSSKIEKCYSTGLVSASGSYKGGLLGHLSSGTVTGCFWNINTSGTTDGVGNVNPDPTGVVGKTTTQMHDINTFLTAGWDFVNIWKMPNMGGYPLLAWQDDIDRYDGGLGTAESPYQIHTTQQLLNLANYLADYNKYFILTADIDLSGLPFTTAVIAWDINNSTTGFQGTPFTGSFDGNNHKITGLTIDASGTNHSFLGLFGQVSSPCAITNLGVEIVSITTGDNAQLLGALIGYAHTGSVISNCYATGSVTAGTNVIYMGGLIGANNGHINDCYAMTTVSGSTNCDYLGGLVGRNCPAAPGYIDNCYSTGAVSAGAGSSDVGGLSGNNAGSVTDSFWDTDTSGQSTSGGGEGKTTTQMQDINTFLAANWDFVNTWRICDGTNYPEFIWQIIKGDLACPDGVTLIDFAIFSQAWLTSSGQPDYNDHCDLVDDNTINLADLTLFAENFLQGL